MPWLMVELTQEETEAAIIQGQLKKWEAQREEEKRLRAEHLDYEASRPWNAGELGSYIRYRAETVLKSPLQADETNSKLLNMLCYYFTNDPRFETEKMHEADDNFSLDKGLLILGDVGVGKTYLMKLFQLTKRCAYEIIDCPILANQFSQYGESVTEVLSTFKPMIKEPRKFYHTQMGACFDDLGAEDDKLHYGNKINVMASILQARYTKRYELPWHLTHATTNLSKSELEERYGSRTWSRMCEMFNMVVFTGDDRRKK